jgi:tetratricopeptide (TPR) repeat protein
MIVKNEEAMLPGCLESVRDVAEEIVVVDTGSTDRSVEVARSYGAKVAHFQWRDDFSAARNESLSHAGGEWVLVLDADERLAAESREELLRLVREPDLAGVNVWLRSRLPEGQGVSEMSTPYCRLFRNLPDIRFSGLVHEQILPAISRRGGKVAASSIVINHLGYERPSPEKLVRNLSLLNRQRELTPNDPFVHLNLGLMAYTLGRGEEAVEYLKTALSLGEERLEPELLAHAETVLAGSCLMLRDWSGARLHARRALARVPAAVQPWFILARACAAEEDYVTALDLFQGLADYAAAGSDPFGTRLRIESVYEAIGICAMKLRRFELARSAYRSALEHSDRADLWYQLGNAAFCLERLDEAAEAYQRTLDLRKGLDPHAKARLARCRALLETEAVCG